MSGKCNTCGHDHTLNVTTNESKPFVFPVRAIDNQLPVNLKIMSTFNKVDKNDVRNGRKNYSIIFTSTEATNNAPHIEWRYTDQNLRDLDYTELRDRVSTPLI